MAIENRGPELQVVGITLVTFAIVATLLRCGVRTFIVRKFGFDDWCMIFALINFILFVTCALVGVEYGTGRHHRDLEEDDIATAMKYWWLCYLWYCLAMIASKISIGWFLLRITIRQRDIWIIYGVMVVTVLTGVVFFFVTLLQCRPIEFFWDKNLDGFCIDVQVIIALTYLYSACSVICDFTFALLPIALIWGLNMDKKSKIALVPIMLMACVASAAVVVRFAYVGDFADPDFLWSTLDIAIWSTTEQGLAITAGSLATLRPLMRIIIEKMGYSSGISELKNSDHQDPYRNSGHLPRSGGGSNKHRGPFSLTTFMRGDENENDTELGECPGSVSDTKQPAFWAVTERGESEEELAPRGQRILNKGLDQ